MKLEDIIYSVLIIGKRKPLRTENILNILLLSDYIAMGIKSVIL